MDWQVEIEPVTEKSDNPAFDLSAAKTFPVGADQIVFGRESTCDVVFPPGARVVSSMHGRLYRQPSGDYAIEPFGDHYFEVNGYKAQPGQYVPDGAIIRLGSSKGPAVRVHLTKGPRTDGLLSTLTQAGRTSMGEAMARMGAMQRIIAGVVVLAIAAGGWFWWTLPDFNREMASLRESLAARAKDDFASTDTLRAAAFAVIRRDATGAERLLGTAWPYRPGMLVTNAHVARILKQLRPDESVLVRKPENGGDFVVTGARLHPGYEAFDAFVEEARKTSTGFRSMTDGLGMPSAYDVAVLEVDPKQDLGPLLEVAADSGPITLRPGASLAYAGYPIEGTGAQKSAQIAPTPQLQFGHVTSITDYFLFGTDDTHAYLVQESLPATGGASGSPIIDKSGRVVAILSGGNIVITDKGRAPSAVLVNFAQRADLVLGVIDPASFDLDGERRFWAEVLPRFDSHEHSVVAAAREALAQAVGGAVAEPKEETASLKTGGAVKAGPAQYREHAIDVEAGHTYRFLVYGEQGSTLNLALFRGEDGIDANFGGRSFASLDYTATATETLKLRVVGESARPVGYKLYTFNTGAALAAAPAN